MPRYLDPKADLTFKKIFGQHPKLLISFLNAVMPFEQGRFIEEVEYLPSEMAPESPGRKFSIVDARCIDNHKRQFIVEMQASWEEGFMSRLEFVLMELTEKFKSETISDRKLMVLWLRLLIELENMKKLPPEMKENEDILRAAELCEESAFTPKELAAYEKYWDMVRTEKTAIKSALKKGKAEGIAEGRAKGKEEKARIIAMNMLKDGISIANICKYTGLTKQQVEKIINNQYSIFNFV